MEEKKKGLLSKLGYPSRERRDDYLAEKMNALIEMGVPRDIAAGAAATASAADEMFVRDLDENPEMALAMAIPGAKLGKALKSGARWGKAAEKATPAQIAAESRAAVEAAEVARKEAVAARAQAKRDKLIAEGKDPDTIYYDSLKTEPVKHGSVAEETININGWEIPVTSQDPVNKKGVASLRANPPAKKSK
jgi:hypothetical protein